MLFSYAGVLYQILMQVRAPFGTRN